MYPGSRLVSPAPWISRACFALVGVGVGDGGEVKAVGVGESVASVLVPSAGPRIRARASVPAPARVAAPRARRKERLLSLRGGLSSLTAAAYQGGARRPQKVAAVLADVRAASPSPHVLVL